MVHSFKQVDNANGNTTIEFFEDSKKRQIILQSGSNAQSDYLYETGDLQPQQAISYLKTKYKFKANPNNPSIFRPIAK